MNIEVLLFIFSADMAEIGWYMRWVSFSAVIYYIFIIFADMATGMGSRRALIFPRQKMGLPFYFSLIFRFISAKRWYFQDYEWQPRNASVALQARRHSSLPIVHHVVIFQHGLSSIMPLFPHRLRRSCFSATARRSRTSEVSCIIRRYVLSFSLFIYATKIIAFRYFSIKRTVLYLIHGILRERIFYLIPYISRSR